jgi:outer membrane protein assembly factor BamB/predicted Ser/Thr protein kinase
MDTEIGRFQIAEEIGRGGMGIVYRAYDPVLDRPIALKLLAPHLGDNPNALLRFHREAAHISSLKHANIALVYDYGEHEGQPYIAMEWVEGRTLKAVLQEEGPLSLDRSLRIFDQLASALDYAHQHGVIHRDLKPANIIVDEHDSPTIVDFGLAWLEDAPSLTMTGSVLGTPLYMAPEQIAGEAVDGRADLYSLAVILYEMLAGRTPFGGGDAGTPVIIQQQLYASPPPISEFNPTLPDHVERALSVALSKQPGDRFATAALFAQALREPDRVRASTTVRRRRRRRWLWALGGLALLAAALLIIGEWDAIRGWLAGDGSDGEPYTGPYYDAWPMPNGGPDQARLVETEFYSLADSPRWKQEAENGYSTPLAAASGRIFVADGDLVQAFDWASGESVWEPPHLGADISAPLALFDDEEILLLLVATDDGQLYALNGYDAGLVWRISGDELEGAIVGGLTVGDNGLLYAATDTGWIHAIDPYSSEIEFTFVREGSEFIFPPAATNAALYVVDSDGLLLALDPASQQVAWTVEAGGAPVAPALVGEAWGHVVTVAAGDGTGALVRAFSGLTGDLVWEVALDEPVTGLAADWRHVYATTETGGLHAYDGANGALDWSVELGDEPAMPPLTNSDQVVVSTADGRVQTFSAESGEPAPGPDLTLDAPLTHPPMTVGGWIYAQTDEVVVGIGP